MNKTTFYGNFAAAFGTCWLATMILALAARTHVNPGALGLFGFPLIGLSYALFRMVRKRS